jgi:hypothetical protein
MEAPVMEELVLLFYFLRRRVNAAFRSDSTDR